MIPLSAFALSPVHSGMIYTQSDAGLHISFDGGASWSLSRLPANPPPAPGGSARSPLQATPRILPTRTPGQLYLASDLSAYCFLRSDDDGTTWHGYLLDRSCGSPAVDPADPDTLRIAVDGDGGPRLWVSRDGGETGELTAALPALGSLYDFAGGGGFLLAADQGLFRAAAEAGPWLPANRGFTASAIGAVLATKGPFSPLLW